jgi:hypothetical protein
MDDRDGLCWGDVVARFIERELFRRQLEDGDEVFYAGNECVATAHGRIIRWDARQSIGYVSPEAFEAALN